MLECNAFNRITKKNKFQIKFIKKTEYLNI